MRRFVTVMVAVVLAVVGNRGQAQDKVVLTIAVPQWYQSAYDDAYFAAFREANPEIDVVLAPDPGNSFYPPSAAYSSVDEHLKQVSKYVSRADVLFASTWTISRESTRAGLWLDIEPLVAAERRLDETNFYPPAWRAFRWEGGMWAMPTELQIQILVYVPTAFDKAGLAYPNANWTLADYIEAAKTFTVRDADGKPLQPGCGCDPNLLFYGLLGHGLADSSGTPQLEDPELAALVELWAHAQKEIYPEGDYSSESVPILIDSPWMLNSQIPGGTNMVPGALPNQVYGAEVSGFGISAGTDFPEQAFKLVQYLAENPVNSFGEIGLFPALRDVEAADAENNTFTSLESLPPEQQQLLREAAETAVAGGDFHYFDYLSSAIFHVASGALDAMSALQAAQQQALADYQAAAEWRDNEALAVATPIPTLTFDTNEVAVNFGVGQWGLSNPATWEQLAREFAEADPLVGQVRLKLQGIGDQDEWQQANDCYYFPYDLIGPYSPEEYLALDPLLDADPAFDPNDFVPAALAALQQDGRTYAYPLAVQIATLRYNPAHFEQAGIPLPGTTWTTNEFADALNQLEQAKDQADYAVPFAPRTAEDTDWLLLIAAYGGLPLDYRTNPPTWNFTDPATVEAIRQVLDLAKAGIIDYQKLGTFNYTGTQPLGALNATVLGGSSFYEASNQEAFVSYPQGREYPALSLSMVAGGYIKADTLNPEACYRWLAFMAHHSELFGQVMPARLSAIEDPVTLAVQGESAVALYREYAALATAPETVNFPGIGAIGFETFFIHQFLDRAFDAYVLDDADLETVLLPDLAVEVKSPDDKLPKMREKAAYYLEHDCRMVWLVYTERRMVIVLTPEGEDILSIADELDGGEVLPGFTLKVADIFPQ